MPVRFYPALVDSVQGEHVERPQGQHVSEPCQILLHLFMAELLQPGVYSNTCDLVSTFTLHKLMIQEGTKLRREDRDHQKNTSQNCAKFQLSSSSRLCHCSLLMLIGSGPPF